MESDNITSEEVMKSPDGTEKPSHSYYTFPGVTLTKEEEKVIRELVENGDVVAAQKLILKLLDKWERDWSVTAP